MTEHETVARYRQMFAPDGTFDLETFADAWQAAQADPAVAAELRRIHAEYLDRVDPWEAEWLVTPEADQRTRKVIDDAVDDAQDAH